MQVFSRHLCCFYPLCLILQTWINIRAIYYIVTSLYLLNGGSLKKYSLQFLPSRNITPDSPENTDYSIIEATWKNQKAIKYLAESSLAALKASRLRVALSRHMPKPEIMLFIVRI